MKRHWPLLLGALLVVAGVRQAFTVSDLRAAAAEVGAELEAVRQKSAGQGSQPPVTLPAAEELDALKARAARVHGFRGEATLAQQRLDNLTALVGQLTAKVQAREQRTVTNAPPEFPPGYRPRHELSNAGAATVDAAVETFWWALCQGDSDALKSVVWELANEQGPGVMPPQAREQIRVMFQSFPGFRIASREPVHAEKTRITIETAPGARPYRLTLVAQSGRWWVLMEESDKW